MLSQKRLKEIQDAMEAKFKAWKREGGGMNDKLKKWKRERDKAMADAKQWVRKALEKISQVEPQAACSGEDNEYEATEASSKEYFRAARLCKGSEDCLTVAIPVIGNLCLTGSVTGLFEEWLTGCLSLEVDYVGLVRDRVEECLYDLEIADEESELQAVIEAQGIICFVKNFWTMAPDPDGLRGSVSVEELSKRAKEVFGGMSEENVQHWKRWSNEFLGWETRFWCRLGRKQ